MVTKSIVHVVKVGGSLLEAPGFALRLHRYLLRNRAAHQILIAGGGALVEQVRRWHAASPIDVVAAHWMCIDLMSVTARLVRARLPELTLVDDDRWLLSRLGEPGATLFDAASWLRHAEPRLPGRTLAPSWDVTSDAIAGRLSVALRADRLVLLKSAPPPEGCAFDLRSLAAAKYIDDELAQMARELPPVEFVDVRHAAW